MDTNKDYYKILGVSPSAEPEALKAVFRALAKKYHPDTTSEPSTSQKFRDIQEAYDVLSDPELRKIYDREKFEDIEVEEVSETAPEAPSPHEVQPKEKSKPKGGMKKMIIIAAAIAVLLLGGGATTFFLMSGSDKKEEKAKVKLPPPPGPMTTYTFPKILADLKNGLCKSNYLSMRFTVEVGTNYTKSIQKHQPKLLNTIMLHLRALERKSLVGKVGAEQLRTDITTIINRKIKPGKIEGVIFKEFILQ